MPITLADWARSETDNLRRAIIDIYRKESMIMDALPFEDAGTLKIEVRRTKRAPRPAFRKINADFSESKGTFEPLQETVHDFGGQVDVDKMIDRDKNQNPNQRAWQTQEYVRSMAYLFNNYFINGNPADDPDGITGIRHRLINEVSSSQTVTAAGLDVSIDATSLAANQAKLLWYMNQAMHKLSGHRADLILVNSSMYLSLQAAIRAAGGLNTQQDAFDREFTIYRGARIFDMGCIWPDDDTEIIRDTELVDGSAVTGGTYTSMYLMRLGQGQFLNGFYEYPMDVNDLGMLEDGHTMRTVIDWPVGLWYADPRTMARVVGITAA